MSGNLPDFVICFNLSTFQLPWMSRDASVSLREEIMKPEITGRMKAATPMIHVPDVRATAEWYESIGFTILNTYDDGAGGVIFAVVSAGATRVFFNEGGGASAEHRREVDLYVDVDEVDELYSSLKDRVEVVKGPHDTFYGTREIIIRDLNRFWITFGKDLGAGSAKQERA